MKKELDFQPATAKLNDLMYSVSLQPIRAFSNFFNRDIIYPSNKYLAVINEETAEIISVVSRNYKLLPNKEALHLAKSIYVSLFKNVNYDDLVPFKVIAPTSLASCHIDLVHKDVKLSHSDWQQDTWYPFLRMSNSYNRTKAFALELGFVRKLCSNGLIFNKETIEVKINHDKLQVDKLNLNVEKLKKHEEMFVQHLNKMKAKEVQASQVFEMVCEALDLKFDVDSDDIKRKQREIERKDKIQKLVKHISDAYFSELGFNAYAVLSTITDFVSHQDDYNCLQGFSINPNIFYKKAGQWMQGF